MPTSEERLSLAICGTANAVVPEPTRRYEWYETPNELAAAILAADPTIALDMELGRRLRDEQDGLLAEAIKDDLGLNAGDIAWSRPHEAAARIRQALLKSVEKEGDTDANEVEGKDK